MYFFVTENFYFNILLAFAIDNHLITTPQRTEKPRNAWLIKYYETIRLLIQKF